MGLADAIRRHVIEPMKTNTTASPVKDSHPLEIFSADLSVFQAHLPWQIDITAGPLGCNNPPERWNRAMRVLQPVIMT
jgi:hypothetical protein